VFKTHFYSLDHNADDTDTVLMMIPCDIPVK